jgi:hypothetical protein
MRKNKHSESDAGSITDTFVRWYLPVLLLLLLVPAFTFGQIKINPEHPGDIDSIPEYQCNILRNNPDSVSHFTVSLMPCFPVEYGTSNIPMAHIASAEIGFNVGLNKSIDINGGFAMSYYNSRDLPNFSPARFKPWQNIHLGLSWFFSTMYKESVQHVAFVWLHGHNPGTGTNLFFKGTTLLKIGLQGGISAMDLPINSNYTEFTGYDVNDPSMKKISLNHDPKYAGYQYLGYTLPWTYYTNMNIRIISIGLVIDRISDFKADLCEKRTKEVMKRNRFYASLLLAPYVAYDDIIVNAPVADPAQTINVDKFSPKSNLGFKLGWSFYNLRTFGGSRSFEVGYMPNAGLYALLKIGIALNPKIAGRR